MVRKWRQLTGTLIGFGLLLLGLSATNPIKSAISEPSQVQSEQQRLILLENALAPQTAEEAALSWAWGVRNRNGALQFAILSPELRSQTKAKYTAANWVTGASSPWAESYKIIRQQQEAGGWEFEIEYQLMTSGGSAGSSVDRIRVEQLPVTKTHPQGWYITQLLAAPTNLLFGCGISYR